MQQSERKSSKDSDDFISDKIDWEEVAQEVRAFQAYPVPPDAQAIAPQYRLVEQIRTIYTSDQLDLAHRDQFNDLVMRFLLSLGYGVAYEHIFMLSSSVHAGMPGKSLRYIGWYRSSFCQDERRYRPHCLSLLAEQIALHASQRDRAAVERAREELATTVRNSPPIQAELAAAKQGLRAENPRKLYLTYPVFSGLFPQLDLMMRNIKDKPSLFFVELERLSARSYYLTMAAGASLGPLLNLQRLDEDGEIEDDTTPGLFLALSLAHIRAVQTGDRSMALLTAEEIAGTLNLGGSRC